MLRMHITCAAHQAQIDRRVDEGDGEHDDCEALAEHGDERDGEDEDGEGLEHVGTQRMTKPAPNVPMPF